MDKSFKCRKCGKENKYSSIRFEGTTKRDLILEMKVAKTKEVIINCTKCGTANKVTITIM